MSIKKLNFNQKLLLNNQTEEIKRLEKMLLEESQSQLTDRIETLT